MRIFISKNNKMKIATSKGIKEFHPFYLINNENMEDVSKLNGLEDIGKIFNLNQLITISKDIDNKIIEFNKKVDTLKEVEKKLTTILSETNDNYDKLGSKADTIKYVQSCLDETVDRLIGLTEKIESIEFNGEKEANKFKSMVKSETDRILNHMESISNIFKEEVLQKAKEMEVIDNNINLKLNSKISRLETTIKESVKDIDGKLQQAKKWACNPVNMPVEDGLFSARHYSQANKNTTIVVSNATNLFKGV